MNKDKYLERERFENRSAKLLKKSNFEYIPKFSNQGYVEFIESEFEKVISNYANGVGLEIGCGTRLFSINSLNKFNILIASDISINSLKFLKKMFINKTNAVYIASDLEELPVQINSIDCIISAGSLSYGDNSIVLKEIYNALSPGGIFIGLDSLNNNPIYKLNRWLHFIRGRRTESTLKRMPDSRLIDEYIKKFSTVSVDYYGCAIYLEPILKKILKIQNTSKYMKILDNFFKVKNSAFKFIIVAIK